MTTTTVTQGEPQAPAAFFAAVGKRKNAIARVRLCNGSGKLSINEREAEDYFGREVLRQLIAQPIEAVSKVGQIDVIVNVRGGGQAGQAGAIRHGIARALIRMDKEMRPVLKKGGFLTRDARKVERKKPGRPGARKRFQFSKR
ncbi:MAG TPA: 30S ribosomal protein S9 [Myxococcota bacterium]|jgi:small subunit ribosomal protein S9|nr:30S ribosomal protein S9 [Myxococcota bacterium]